MNKFVFVNFEDYEEKLENESISNEEIANRMEISIDELEEDYEILLLSPITEIISRELQRAQRNYRTYTIDELIAEANIILSKSIQHNKIIEMNETLLELSARSFIEVSDIGGTLPGVAFPDRYHIMVVIPNESTLRNRDFIPITTEELDETRQFLNEHNLIRH